MIAPDAPTPLNAEEDEQREAETLRESLIREHAELLKRHNERLAALEALPPEIQKLTRKQAREIGLWF